MAAGAVGVVCDNLEIVMQLKPDTIRRMLNSDASAWREECPDEKYWYFTKRNKFGGYRATIDWERETVTFARLRRID
jgi:hypothetical protein